MEINSSFHNSDFLRKKVAHEAAVLLYTSQEKEYKQAKDRAARNLGARMLPTNIEIAEELDLIAEENEGQARHDRLIQMRKEALEIMTVLKSFDPKLVGSVWRGTTRLGSDIDITVYSSSQSQIINKLKEKGFNITKTEFISTPTQKKARESFHVFMTLLSGDEVEIVVRYPDEEARIVRCEIYGDVVKGLDLNHLRKVLTKDPLKRFVP
jgi:predicted nucleotidyltransferase